MNETVDPTPPEEPDTRPPEEKEQYDGGDIPRVETPDDGSEESSEE